MIFFLIALLNPAPVDATPLFLPSNITAQDLSVEQLRIYKRVKDDLTTDHTTIYKINPKAFNCDKVNVEFTVNNSKVSLGNCSVRYNKHIIVKGDETSTIVLLSKYRAKGLVYYKTKRYSIESIGNGYVTISSINHWKLPKE